VAAVNTQVDCVRKMYRSREDLEAVVRGTKIDMEAAESARSACAMVLGSVEGRHVWTDREEKELERLMTDEGYRLEVLGAQALDYQRLGAYLHRSESAVRKKCWSMVTKKQEMERLRAERQDKKDEASHGDAAGEGHALPHSGNRREKNNNNNNTDGENIDAGNDDGGNTGCRSRDRRRSSGASWPGGSKTAGLDRRRKSTRH
jgi:hypothetical protein